VTTVGERRYKTTDEPRRADGIGLRSGLAACDPCHGRVRRVQYRQHRVARGSQLLKLAVRGRSIRQRPTFMAQTLPLGVVMGHEVVSGMFGPC